MPPRYEFKDMVAAQYSIMGVINSFVLKDFPIHNDSTYHLKFSRTYCYWKVRDSETKISGTVKYLSHR